VIWRRHWTDWVGFVAQIIFALKVVLRSGSIGVLMFPTMLHELLIAYLFMSRDRAVRTARGWRPVALAFGAGYFVPIFVAVASTWRHEWLATSASALQVRAGLFFWLFGAVLGIWPLWFLRRSFSIVPQARHLVTEGPYSLARHPIYSSYLLQYFGLWLSHATLALGLALALWLVMLLLRMRYEESVLESAFPEYAAYRTRVGPLAPRFRTFRNVLDAGDVKTEHA
jgi:protein-S-isoprenylcysteine O-methyltransferase Ste14